MSAQRQLEYNHTEAEYWRMAEDSGIKLEFWDGQIYAMAGATPKHNDIAVNVVTSLKVQLRGKPCVPRTSDQRVKAAKLQTYPDVVAFRPLQYDPGDANTLIDSTVIAGVLSDSTARNDRNAKFDAYKQLPSLRYYLLISQTPHNFEHHFLDADGVWQSEIFTNFADIVRLSAVECELLLGEIYEDIELAD